MTVQARTDNDTTSFAIYTYPASRQDDGLISQDGARAAILAQYTLMGKVVATGEWIPFIDPTAVDGSAVNYGIYMGDDIAAATLVAGDVLDAPILITGMKFDEAKLIFDDGVDTLDTVVGAATVQAKTVRDILLEQNLIPAPTQSGSRAENV